MGLQPLFTSDQPAVREITLRVRGQLDLALGMRMGEITESKDGLRCRYLLDLGGATVLDSGLAWIIMFKRRVEDMGGSVVLLGVATDLQQRCAKLGIGVDSLAA
jgi:anti-anti-sigma regulatory factor